VSHEEKIDRVYEEVQSGKKTKEEGAAELRNSMKLTQEGAEDTLDRWPIKKREHGA
jgi:hypothetical protein